MALDDDEQRHSFFEQMIEKENAELEEDIINMQAEIRRIDQEREEQR